MDFKSQIKSTVPTGTAPLSVTSTTLVSNLNVEKLGGQNSTYYTTAANINITDSGSYFDGITTEAALQEAAVKINEARMFAIAMSIGLG